MNKKTISSILIILFSLSLLTVNTLPTFAISCLNGNCTPHTTSYPIYNGSSTTNNPSSHSSYTPSPSSHSSYTPTPSCSGTNCTPHTVSYPIYTPSCNTSYCTPHTTSYPVYTTTTTTKPPTTTTTTKPPTTTTTTTTKPPCCQPIIVPVAYPVYQVVNPTLDFWADKYVINLGESTYLRWSSSNVNYCVASLGWTGPKSTNGWEQVSPSTETTYSLTCYANNGVITRNLTIKVVPPAYLTSSGEVTLSKSGRNLSQGERVYSKNILAKHSDIIEFYISVVNNSSVVLNNVTVKEILPSVLSYRANTTKVNGVLYPDGINQNGINIGNLNVGETKIITFQALALGNTGTYTNFVQITGSNFMPKTDSMTIVFPAIIDASTVKTGSVDGFTLSALFSSFASGGMFYFLKFTDKGKVAFTQIEEKLRKYALEKERKRLIKNKL